MNRPIPRQATQARNFGPADATSAPPTLLHSAPPTHPVVYNTSDRWGQGPPRAARTDARGVFSRVFARAAQQLKARRSKQTPAGGGALSFRNPGGFLWEQAVFNERFKSAGGT